MKWILGCWLWDEEVVWKVEIRRFFSHFYFNLWFSFHAHRVSLSLIPFSSFFQQHFVIISEWIFFNILQLWCEAFTPFSSSSKAPLSLSLTLIIIQFFSAIAIYKKNCCVVETESGWKKIMKLFVFHMIDFFKFLIASFLCVALMMLRPQHCGWLV